MLENALNRKLGKYREYDFCLYEEGDHILVLKHTPCGFEDKFNATSVKIEAILNDCEHHIRECPKYDTIHTLDKARKEYWGKKK